jgi:hypothetical protein
VWTGVCLGLTVLWIVLALLLGRLGVQEAP